MLHGYTETPFFICLIKCINLQQNIDWWQWTTRFLFVWVLIDVVVLCVSPCVLVSIADKNPWGKYINLLSFFVCDSVCVFVCLCDVWQKSPFFRAFLLLSFATLLTLCERSSWCHGEERETYSHFNMIIKWEKVFFYHPSILLPQTRCNFNTHTHRVKAT